MKIKRWMALTVIALVVLSALGFASYRVLASANISQASQDCAAETQDEANETAETAENIGAEECDGQGNEEDASDEAAPANTAITPGEARTIAETANPGALTLNVEFDREAGKLIWEVELDNGMDVQVDAETGDILGTESSD